MRPSRRPSAPPPLRPRALPPARAPQPGGHRRQEIATSPLEYVGFVTLAALVVASGLVWAAGQVSARLFSGAWLTVDVVDMGAVAINLLRAPAAPAAAWPADAAALIPGPVAFWSIFCALLLGPVSGLAWVHARRRRRRAAGQPQPAAWASRRELRPLRVTGPAPGRLTLGRSASGLLAAEPRQSVIVIGRPSRARPRAWRFPRSSSGTAP